MIKRVNNRIENILGQDKLFSPQAICDVLKEEIKHAKLLELDMMTLVKILIMLYMK